MRFICQLNGGDYINVNADLITQDKENDLLIVTDNGNIVAVVASSVVLECHLSKEVPK